MDNGGKEEVVFTQDFMDTIEEARLDGNSEEVLRLLEPFSDEQLFKKNMV